MSQDDRTQTPAAPPPAERSERVRARVARFNRPEHPEDSLRNDATWQRLLDEIMPTLRPAFGPTAERFADEQLLDAVHPRALCIALDEHAMLIPPTAEYAERLRRIVRVLHADRPGPVTGALTPEALAVIAERAASVLRPELERESYAHLPADSTDDDVLRVVTETMGDYARLLDALYVAGLLVVSEPPPADVINLGSRRRLHARPVADDQDDDVDGPQ